MNELSENGWSIWKKSVLQELKNNKYEHTEIKGDLKDLKEDVGSIKTDIAVIKKAVETLPKVVDQINANTANIASVTGKINILITLICGSGLLGAIYAVIGLL